MELRGAAPAEPTGATGPPTLALVRHYAQHVLVLTNIGPLDHDLTPFGDDALGATVVGPFLHDLATPVLTITSFRWQLSAQICTSGHLACGGLDAYAGELEATLGGWQQDEPGRDG